MSSKRDRAEAARAARERLAAQERRRKTVLTSAIAVAVLVVAGLIGWGVIASQKSSGGANPASAVADGTGFAVGTGPVTIDVYADFMCPNCARFEQETGPTLDTLVADGKAKVVYHPIAILDDKSTTRYSTRAAAASAAAADGGKFYPYFKALYAQQPQEGSAGLDNAKLVEIGRSVGLTGSDFAAKVNDGTYKGWVTRSTEAASKRGVTGTPTVYVAGEQVKNPTPEAVTAAVTAAAK